MQKVFYSSSEAETKRIGNEVASSALKGDIFLLVGDLGAGKTVFVKGFVSYFNKKHEVVSPTFTLLNVYDDLYHFDLYRIEKREELANIGVEEFLFGNGISLVEWPEKVGIEFFGERAKIVSIEKCGDNKRKITLENLQ